MLKKEVKVFDAAPVGEYQVTAGAIPNGFQCTYTPKVGANGQVGMIVISGKAGEATNQSAQLKYSDGENDVTLDVAFKISAAAVTPPNGGDNGGTAPTPPTPTPKSPVLDTTNYTHTGSTNQLVEIEIPIRNAMPTKVQQSNIPPGLNVTTRTNPHEEIVGFLVISGVVNDVTNQVGSVTVSNDAGSSKADITFDIKAAAEPPKPVTTETPYKTIRKKVGEPINEVILLSGGPALYLEQFAGSLPSGVNVQLYTSSDVPGMTGEIHITGTALAVSDGEEAAYSVQNADRAELQVFIVCYFEEDTQGGSGGAPTTPSAKPLVELNPVHVEGEPGKQILHRVDVKNAHPTRVAWDDTGGHLMNQMVINYIPNGEPTPDNVYGQLEVTGMTNGEEYGTFLDAMLYTEDGSVVMVPYSFMIAIPNP